MLLPQQLFVHTYIHTYLFEHSDSMLLVLSEAQVAATQNGQPHRLQGLFKI